MAADLALETLGKAWITARGGQPKTVQQHETSLAFAVDRLPDGIAADAVTSTQCQDLLLTRRYTPSIRARKLVRMGVLKEDDDRARMCSVQAEKLFVQDLRAIFEFGIASKPATVDGNPMLQIKARGKNDEPEDPSLAITFEPRAVRGIAALVADPVFSALIILRGMTLTRTGELSNATVDDVDVDTHVINLTGTEGEAPRPSQLGPATHHHA